ncbi:hypothetical protein PCE1_000967 [Barthelona sp. PCE]
MDLISIDLQPLNRRLIQLEEAIAKVSRNKDDGISEEMESLTIRLIELESEISNSRETRGNTPLPMSPGSSAHAAQFLDDYASKSQVDSLTKRLDSLRGRLRRLKTFENQLSEFQLGFRRFESNLVDIDRENRLTLKNGVIPVKGVAALQALSVLCPSPDIARLMRDLADKLRSQPNLNEIIHLMNHIKKDMEHRLVDANSAFELLSSALNVYNKVDMVDEEFMVVTIASLFEEQQNTAIFGDNSLSGGIDEKLLSKSTKALVHTQDSMKSLEIEHKNLLGMVKSHARSNNQRFKKLEEQLFSYEGLGVSSSVANPMMSMNNNQPEDMAIGYDPSGGYVIMSQSNSRAGSPIEEAEMFDFDVSPVVDDVDFTTNTHDVVVDSFAPDALENGENNPADVDDGKELEVEAILSTMEESEIDGNLSDDDTFEAAFKQTIERNSSRVMSGRRSRPTSGAILMSRNSSTVNQNVVLSAAQIFKMDPSLQSDMIYLREAAEGVQDDLGKLQRQLVDLHREKANAEEFIRLKKQVVVMKDQVTFLNDTKSMMQENQVSKEEFERVDSRIDELIDDNKETNKKIDSVISRLQQVETNMLALQSSVSDLVEHSASRDFVQRQIQMKANLADLERKVDKTSMSSFSEQILENIDKLNLRLNEITRSSSQKFDRTITTIQKDVSQKAEKRTVQKIGKKVTNLTKEVKSTAEITDLFSGGEGHFAGVCLACNRPLPAGKLMSRTPVASKTVEKANTLTPVAMKPLDPPTILDSPLATPTHHHSILEMADDFQSPFITESTHPKPHKPTPARIAAQRRQISKNVDTSFFDGKGGAAASFDVEEAKRVLRRRMSNTGSNTGARPLSAEGLMNKTEMHMIEIGLSKSHDQLPPLEVDVGVSDLPLPNDVSTEEEVMSEQELEITPTEKHASFVVDIEEESAAVEKRTDVVVIDKTPKPKIVSRLDDDPAVVVKTHAKSDSGKRFVLEYSM